MSEPFVLPNVRKLFIPDKGYMIFDADLKGADGQVVAWEANDKEMKDDLRLKVDMHKKNAITIGGESFEGLDPESNAYHKLRQSYKHWVHGTNYGGSAFATARHPAINWPVAKSERNQTKYFQLHPGIKEWHLRTGAELASTRTATNKFGYRIIYFDRIDGLLPQALAWVPQSTVALTCFKGALQIERAMPFVEILMQVHDSLVFQVPFAHAERYDDFRRYLSIEIPYPNDPLVIPWGLSRSEKSWGDCTMVEE